MNVTSVTPTPAAQAIVSFAAAEQAAQPTGPSLAPTYKGLLEARSDIKSGIAVLNDPNDNIVGVMTAQAAAREGLHSLNSAMQQKLGSADQMYVMIPTMALLEGAQNSLKS